jgi:hypothetical protein
MDILERRLENVLGGLYRKEKPNDFDKGCMTAIRDALDMLRETRRDAARWHQEPT